MYLYAYILGIRDLAVTVDIPGIGVVNAENAAQDSTLNAILGAIQAQSKASSGGGGGTSGLNAVNTSATKTASGIGILGRSSSQTADSFSKAGDKARQAGENFASASGTVFSSLGMLASQSNTASGMIASLGGGASKVLGMLPGIGALLGGAAGVLTGVLTKNVESYEKLLASGGSFGYSLSAMQDIAHGSGLTLGMLAGIVQKAGGALSMFGGTTLKGAKQFAAANKEIRAEAGAQLLRMGISFQDQGQYLAEFMGDLARGGADISKFSTKDLQKSFLELTTQQKIMSQYNGITIEQQREAIKAAKADIKLQGSFNDLSYDSRLVAEQLFGNLKLAIPGAEQMMQEIFATGGAGTISAEMGALASALPGLFEEIKGMQRDVAAGTLQKGDVARRLDQAFSTITQEQVTAAKKLANQQNLNQGASLGAFDAIAGASIGLEETLRKQRGEVIKNARSDAGLVVNEKGMTDLDRNINEIATGINTFAIDIEKLTSTILQSKVVNTVLGKLVDFGKGIDTAVKGPDGIISRLDNLVIKGPGDEAAAMAKFGVELMGELGKSFFDKILLELKKLTPFNGDPVGTPNTPLLTVPVRPTTVQSTDTSQISGGSGDDTLAGGAGNDRLTVAKIDVAVEMQTNNMLLQKLTEQVRRSSEDNARTVSNAIAYS